jgi:hypothetical protein
MRLSLLCGCILVSACGASNTSNDMMMVMDMSVPDVDAGPSECNPVVGGVCPSGEKCTIGTDHGAPREICFPLAASPVSEGGTCSSVMMGSRVGDNCGPGLSCVVYPGEGARCRRPCFVRTDCQSGSACIASTVSNTIEIPDSGQPVILRTCHSDDGCDPVKQSGCSGGKACYLSLSDDVGRVGVCIVPGGKTSGAACRSIVDCAPGLRCDEFGFCRRLCYYQTTSGAAPTTGLCPSGEGTCELFFGGSDAYGICGAL